MSSEKPIIEPGKGYVPLVGGSVVNGHADWVLTRHEGIMMSPYSRVLTFAPERGASVELDVQLAYAPERGALYCGATGEEHVVRPSQVQLSPISGASHLIVTEGLHPVTFASLRDGLAVNDKTLGDLVRALEELRS